MQVKYFEIFVFPLDQFAHQVPPVENECQREQSMLLHKAFYRGYKSLSNFLKWFTTLVTVNQLENRLQVANCAVKLQAADHKFQNVAL